MIKKRTDELKYLVEAIQHEAQKDKRTMKALEKQDLHSAWREQWAAPEASNLSRRNRTRTGGASIAPRRSPQERT